MIGKVKIEIGQIWKDGHGFRWHITERGPGQYPWWGTLVGELPDLSEKRIGVPTARVRTFTSNGTFLIGGRSAEDLCELVSDSPDNELLNICKDILREQTQ